MADPGVKREIESGFVFVRLEYESDEARAFMDRAGQRGYPMMFTVDGARYAGPGAEEGEGQIEAGDFGIRRIPIRWDPQTFAAALSASRAPSP